MRINEPFAVERESEVNNPKKKYFIASEGAITEPKYFTKLNDSIITDNSSIVNILRDYANQGYSNPTYIIKLLQNFIANSVDGITVKELKNRLSNWEHENPGKIDINKAFSKLEFLFKNDEYKIPFNSLDSVFMELFKSFAYEEMAKNFEKYFQSQNVIYSPGIDIVNMVIDRDKDSFTEEQYDNILDYCRKNSVNLYVSNPCFELWLYMHFDEFDGEDNEKLLLNKRASSSGKRYIEKKLYEICKYRKKYLNFDDFEPGIMRAIEREKQLTEDLSEIKTNLGTNVGQLVKNMISEK